MTQADLVATGDAHRLSRPLDRAWLGGVCAGLSGHLGLAPSLVRALFLAFAAWKLVGVGAYLVLWLALPPAGAASAAPGVEAATRRGLRTAVDGPARTADLGQAIALALLLVGLGWLVQGMGWGLDWLWLGAGSAGAAGLGIAWWQADRAEQRTVDPRLGWRRLVAPFIAHWTTVLALVAALLLFGVAVLLTILALPALDPLGGMAVASGLVVALLVGAAAPWALRVRRALVQARQQKLLSDARADMAAHLHDSVLQTLALIQRQATDARAVVRLARRQERQLRQWLYGEESTADTVRDALVEAAQAVEDDFPVQVECVTVGDAPLSPALAELVKAAREAMVNAAKHSGTAVVDVYAEVSDDLVEVFVRDRGQGFDPDAVAEDRMGVRGSILDRMERHGGVARIRSGADRGTEVNLEMKR